LYGNLQVVFEEASKEKLLQITQFLMKPSGSFMNHSKAISFRVLMNKRTRIASFDTIFPI